MADRKVLIKYYPKNFDPQLIVKRGRGKDKLMMVRNMLPMSIRCNVCSNYLYIGTKFNMRMQICNDETYLGIKVFRFYLKCMYCYNDITFKTDPKNHDYVVEMGGIRNYQSIKDAQQAQKLLKKMKTDEKEGDSMKFLETRTYDSKREMELNQALEDIKNLNKRKAIIDPEDLLKNMIYEEIQEDNFTEEQEIEINKHYEQLREKLNSAQKHQGQQQNTQKLPSIKEENDQDRPQEDMNLLQQFTKQQLVKKQIQGNHEKVSGVNAKSTYIKFQSKMPKTKKITKAGKSAIVNQKQIE